MSTVVIENPVINSAFEEPKRHFKFDQDGITNEIAEFRRISHYFVPIARPKKKSQQIEIDLGLLSQDRVEENTTINRIRERVSLWRRGGYTGITPTTRRLLEHWKNSDRERRLFFCQIEALETVIYLTEVAKQVLESMPEVVCYVKNQGLGFTIPYTLAGQQKNYTPDFIARVRPPSVPPTSGGGKQERGEKKNQGKREKQERRDKCRIAIAKDKIKPYSPRHQEKKPEKGDK